MAEDSEEDDDVPISKLVTRLRQQQQQQRESHDEEEEESSSSANSDAKQEGEKEEAVAETADTPPPSPSTRTPPPSPTSAPSLQEPVPSLQQQPEKTTTTEKSSSKALEPAVKETRNEAAKVDETKRVSKQSQEKEEPKHVQQQQQHAPQESKAKPSDPNTKDDCGPENEPDNKGPTKEKEEEQKGETQQEQSQPLPPDHRTPKAPATSGEATSGPKPQESAAMESHIPKPTTWVEDLPKKDEQEQHPPQPSKEPKKEDDAPTETKDEKEKEPSPTEQSPTTLLAVVESLSKKDDVENVASSLPNDSSIIQEDDTPTTKTTPEVKGHSQKPNKDRDDPPNVNVDDKQTTPLLPAEGKDEKQLSDTNDDKSGGGAPSSDPERMEVEAVEDPIPTKDAEGAPKDQQDNDVKVNDDKAIERTTVDKEDTLKTGTSVKKDDEPPPASRPLDPTEQPPEKKQKIGSVVSRSVTLRPPQRAPPKPIDMEELRDAFPQMAGISKKAASADKEKKGRSSKAKRRRAPKPLRIRINNGDGSQAKGTTSTSSSSRCDEMNENYQASIRRFDQEDEETDLLLEQEFEDSLAFFSETHEDQDPDFIEFTRKKEKERCEDELARIDQEDEKGTREIETIVAGQLKEKQASADRNIERLRSKANTEEQRDLQKLLQLYNEKVASNQSKINQGVKLLTRRHQQEMHKAMLQHRQQAQQRGLPEQVANSEWTTTSQQLQAKHQNQMQEFNTKGEDVKKKCEADYVREQEKLRKHHEKRKRDMEHGMQKVLARMHSNFQQQRERHLQRHKDKMKKKREQVMSKVRIHHEASSTPKDNGKNSLDSSSSVRGDSRVELRVPSPVELNVVSGEEGEGEKPGAAARYKNRKTILSVIQKQVSVEIHNEGLWISSLSEKRSEDAKKEEGEQLSKGSDKKDEIGGKIGQDGEFIPWGVKARTVLHSIVCGEIPDGYGAERFDLGEAFATQAGLIRCVITDLRTGEATASSQRAETIKEQEGAQLAELEEKAKQLGELALEAEKNCSSAEADEKEYVLGLEKAEQEVEKARKLMQEFQTKFKDYFGPDGNPVMTTNPEDRQKLMNAMLRYKTHLEGAETREKTVRSALTETKAHSQKMQAMVKQTQKAATAAAATLKKKKAMLSDAKGGRAGRQRVSDSAELERAATRVGDVISAFRRTAERRREQLNQKRSSSASSRWVQALPGISAPLKKSLWHKMHRRRQQIVLRPTMESLVDGLYASVNASTTYSRTAESKEQLDKALRAEQLLLLTTFPVAPREPLPTAPSSRSTDLWAEPGWHLNLDVPSDDRRCSTALLPRAPSFPHLQQSHSEICSVPGRQAASMLRNSIMRTLTTPLSVMAHAISLAETNPSVKSESCYSKNDPLRINEASMLTGYNFSLKKSSKESAQSRKRASTSAPKEESGRSSPSKRSKTSVDTLPSPKSSSTPTAPALDGSGSSERRSSKSSRGTRKSRSKTSDGGLSSPRTPTKSKSKASAQNAAQDTARQALESQARSYMQQQVAASASLGVRGAYGQQQPQPTMDQQAAAQYSQYMQQRDALQMQQHAPTMTSPQQTQQLQQLQPQQPQMQVPTQPQQMQVPQQQLLPQYASPQQYHQQQQRQMAHMRMMQQQQVSPSYAQTQAPQPMPGQMPYFQTMPQPPTRQQSFGSQPPMPMAMGRSGVVGQPPVMGMQSPRAPPPSPGRRVSQQQGGDDTHNDPLLFLNDLP